MSILNFWRREWRVRVSPRLAILGMVLLVLCVLAVLQFRWIDRVAQAERERAKRDLTAAVSNFERDFDMEVTRLVTIFEFPAQDASEYAKRYKEWLRLAPYPNMIHGVYIFDPAEPGSPLREAVPGEPVIRSADWERDLPNLALPLERTTARESLSVRPTPPGAEEVSAVVRAWSFPIPGVLVDGNPAFVFPIVPSTPGPGARGSAQIAGEPGRLTATLRMTRRAGSLPSQWIVIVLDANYLQSTLLPNLLRIHLPIAASSGYDALVVDNTRSSPRRILYQSPSAPAEEQFAHADGVAGLFLLRPDCFAPTLLANGMAIAKTRAFPLASRPDLPVTYTSNMGFVRFATEGRPLMSADRLAEILRRRPQSCTDAPVQISANSIAPWELLVRYRAGSLDQAMVTFRRRNLLWSVAVLSILVVGIAMLVLLTERARSLAQMQSEFVLGVSHELRTPLTVIRVAADNLKKGMVEDGEQARLYGDIIATQTSELSDMIEETLVFARVQSRALIRRRAPVNAEEIVKSSLLSYDSALRAAGIAAEVHLAPQLPPVRADARLLERCLGNLIQNVVKYAETGKWMAIRADLAVLPEGDRIRISVEDRGPGIPPADLPHIFEPFYRGTCAQTDDVSGLGLGLTLVKRVVEAHLGKIAVASSNRGTSFTILLRPWDDRKNRGEPQP